MRLQEIQNALANIVRINTSLNEEKLKLLLASAGWDESDIRDAILLWKNNMVMDEMLQEKENVHVSTEDDITIEKAKDESILLPEVYVPALPEISTENFSLVTRSANVLSEESHKTSEAKITKSFLIGAFLSLFSSKKKIDNEDNKATVETHDVAKSYNTLSEPHVPKQTSYEDLPENLPLRPYESGNVTVPLKEYERRFFSAVSSIIHPQKEKKITTEEKNEEKVPLVKVVEPPKIVRPEEEKQTPSSPEMKEKAPLARPIPHVAPMEEIYRGQHTIPFASQDKYVITAACMLFLVLLLLLGYMYSNGRL